MVTEYLSAERFWLCKGQVIKCLKNSHNKTEKESQIGV